MTAAPTGVSDEASQLLQYIVDAALADVNTLPTRQLVTAGQAVWDCEEVYVTMVGVTTGLAGSTIPGLTVVDACPLPWTATYEAAIIRCVPTSADDGTPPSPEALLAAAEQMSKDTLCLMQAAESRAALRFGGVGVSITFPIPQGGFGGVSGRFSITVST